MDKGKQKNQYLEINIYWIYCRLSFIRIMFLYVVCWMILLTMKGKRKEKKSDARLQTKTDWTPRLWVEAQCSICPTTYLRSHRTPITCFIHSREKRKRKERRAVKRKWKAWCPWTPITCFIHRREKRKRKERRAAKRKWKAWCPWTRANKGRSDQNAIWLNMPNSAQNSKLHTKKYICHTSKTSKDREWGNNKREKKIPMIRQRQIGGGEAQSQWLNMPLLPRPCVPTVVHYNVFCSHSNTTHYNVEPHNCTFSIWIYCMNSELHCRVNMGLFV